MSTAQPSLWWRRAVRDTILGVVAGLLTAGTLIWIEHDVFAPLLEFGEDSGIRAKVALDRLHDPLGTMPVDEPGRTAKDGPPAATYVFLDVDPDDIPSDRGASGASACEALAVRQAESSAASGAASPLRHLDCHDGRPVNRYLMAEIVSTLRARGARLIVLDVRLGREAGVVPEDEANALDRVLGAASPADGAAIVFAAPVLHAPAESTGFAVEALPDPAGKPDGTLGNRFSNGHVFQAVAVAADDHPIRRYARCVPVEHQERPWPTLPWQAVQLLHPSSEPCETKEAALPPPRIVFTLPAGAGYDGDVPEAAKADWAWYRSVYNRCRASDLWRGGHSRCANASFLSGQVVVVGASNPVRGDAQLTPIGYMNGAEVVINAMRSFEQYPELEEPRPAEVVARKIRIVLLCACVWLAFNLWRHRRDARWRGVGNQTLVARILRRLQFAAVFLATLAVVLGLTLYLSLRTLGPVPSFDIFLGVLALSLEQYVEAIQWVHHGMTKRLDRLLGLGDKHAPH